MIEFDRIKKAADFVYNSQGSINLDLLCKMVSVPDIVVINVITQCGYTESRVPKTHIKPPPSEVRDDIK